MHAVSVQMLFVIAAMAATFLLVPRGFSAGEIDIQSDHMSWNTTKGTYQLNLLARIPINNPNFLNVSGQSSLSFQGLACDKAGTHLHQHWHIASFCVLVCSLCMADIAGVVS